MNSCSFLYYILSFRFRLVLRQCKVQKSGESLQFYVDWHVRHMLHMAHHE